LKEYFFARGRGNL